MLLHSALPCRGDVANDLLYPEGKLRLREIPGLALLKTSGPLWGLSLLKLSGLPQTPTPLPHALAPSSA